jgi:hypothetical protein
MTGHWALSVWTTPVKTAGRSADGSSAAQRKYRATRRAGLGPKVLAPLHIARCGDLGP